ncbi:uncharacterized protein LOC143040715 [Oratosquilla oratoria]|uniref:uncharacterized protein LOC143040715 n=1 Tax=Oratosquilla oratoria TaxID=337810 RepID=UPI003F75AB9A
MKVKSKEDSIANRRPSRTIRKPGRFADFKAEFGFLEPSTNTEVLSQQSLGTQKTESKGRKNKVTKIDPSLVTVKIEPEEDDIGDNAGGGSDDNGEENTEELPSAPSGSKKALPVNITNLKVEVDDDWNEYEEDASCENDVKLVEKYRGVKKSTARQRGEKTPSEKEVSHAGEHRCNLCDINFDSVFHLKQHESLQHNGKKPYCCLICGKDCKQSSNLVKHLRIHTGERPFKCIECGATFVQSSHLQDHIRTHTGERPFECEECGATYTQRSRLAVHKRKHKGDRPFQCDVCFASFYEKSALNIHKRTHTGEKPYECEECGQRFSQLSRKKIHQRLHTGERPYKCTECTMDFNEKAALERHKGTHIPKARQKCDICGETFSKLPYLTLHKKIHNTNEQYQYISGNTVNSSQRQRPSKFNAPAPKFAPNNSPHPPSKTPPYRPPQTPPYPPPQTPPSPSVQTPPYISNQTNTSESAILASSTAGVETEVHAEYSEDEAQVDDPSAVVKLDQNSEFYEETNGVYREEAVHIHASDQTDLFEQEGLHPQSLPSQTFFDPDNEVYNKKELEHVSYTVQAQDRRDPMELDTQSEDCKDSLELDEEETDSKLIVLQPSTSVLPSGKFYMYQDGNMTPVENIEIIDIQQVPTLTSTTVISEPVHEPGNPHEDTPIITEETFISSDIGDMPEMTLEALDLHNNELEHNAVSTELYPCDTCDIMFTNRKVLRKHMRAHKDGRTDLGKKPKGKRMKEGGDKRYVCNLCGASFATFNRHRSHQKVHEGVRSFICGTCGAAFNKKSTLTKHSKVHMGDTPYSCMKCLMSFTTKAQLGQHRKDHRTLYKKDMKFMCHECDKSFTEAGYIIHMRNHAGEKPFECSQCGKKFVSKANLKLHTRTHTGEKPYICGVCSTPFKQLAHLKSHMFRHTGERPYKCNICDLAFTQSSSLREHKKRHIKQHIKKENDDGSVEENSQNLEDLVASAFQCILKDGDKVEDRKKFRLKRGRKKIRESDSFCCKICGSTFISRVGMKLHMMRHTGEKPHSCRFCNKAFYSKPNLTMHERVHTGEKPYKCGTCGASFKQVHHLRSHIRGHMGEKPYQCEICKTAFVQRSSLVTHVKIVHSGKGKYKCDKCEASYAGKMHLSKHMRTIHGIERVKCKQEYTFDDDSDPDDVKMMESIEEEKDSDFEIGGKGQTIKKEVEETLSPVRKSVRGRIPKIFPEDKENFKTKRRIQRTNETPIAIGVRARGRPRKYVDPEPHITVKALD